MSVATWYCRELGDGVQAHAPSIAILQAFMEMALAKAAAGGMVTDEAVFSESELAAQRVTVYFTPTAAPLAQQFDAVPCEKPVPRTRRFSLLAGDQPAWEAHFPGHLEQQRSGNWDE